MQILSFQAILGAIAAQALNQLAVNAADVGSYCTSLSQTLGSKVVFPNSTGYLSTIADYWSLQEAQLSPACIVVPVSAQDVSAAVKILSADDGCPFAVKGGGHAVGPGFANINGTGVTIDMTAMKSVAVNDAHTVTRVEAGAKWLDAYTYLDALGLSVAGGRNGAVGVGGLTIGGGISYFSPRIGWVCDGVVNFEVVLASGELVDANATSHLDLFRALKGGSNNFGVVSAYSLSTFAQGDIWGGILVHPISAISAVLKAFYDIASAPTYDVYASIVTGFSFNSTTGAWVIAHLPTYTKAEANATVYSELLAIQPVLTNTLKVQNISTLTNEAKTPTLNQIFYTGTYAASLDMLTQVVALANTTIQPTLPSVKGSISWNLGLEPLPTVITQYGAQKGGNVLGTSPKDGNAFVLLLSAQWTDSASSPLVLQTAAAIMKNIDEYASSHGFLHTFRYLNYANERQDPIDSYGKDNVELLREVSQTYDKEGVFQRLVTGGFKLW